MKLINRDREEYREDGIQYFTKEDSRKPRLSLKHLNKLRKTREIRNFEKEFEREQLEKIYGNNDNNESGI